MDKINVSFTSIFKREILERTNRLFSFDMTRTAQKTKTLRGYTDRGTHSHIDNKVISDKNDGDIVTTRHKTR
jgi:hypothetical protein